jgi:dihydrofolate synthase/folylpolyglutamate synthase
MRYSRGQDVGLRADRLVRIHPYAATTLTNLQPVTDPCLMLSIDSTIARLTALHPKRIDLSLERMWRILDALDHPERRLPPVIHIAGTNGKGSTIAFMRAILQAGGLRAHAYTSPHLVRFNERFRLGESGDGALVADDELVEVLAECERANADAPITVFEITTAAGLLLFARHPADVLLMEVGLGGRLDATNVVDNPLATVITPVSFDHAEFLGSSIGEIATEKAGILKPGIAAIVAAQPREALSAIERYAARVKAPVRVAGEDWTATEERGRLVYQDDAGLLDLPAPRLYGRHQFENAGVAIAALRAVAAFELAPAAFETGIAAAEWPARMQRLSRGSLAALVPAGAELWLDGGHNIDGGRAIANALADLEERVSRPLVLVVGMLSTKDCEGFLRNFAGLAQRIVAVPISHQEKSAPSDRIADAARAVGIPAHSSADIKSALAAIRSYELMPPPRILITGSLYLAGNVLAANGTPPT